MKVLSAVAATCGMISAAAGIFLVYGANDIQSWRNASTAWVLATIFTAMSSVTK